MKKFLAAIFLLALSSCGGGTPAFARDDGQWTGQSEERRQWFRGLMQPGSVVSCCGDADAYEADLFETGDGSDIIAIITDGTGNDTGKPTIPDGTRFTVPARKIVVNAKQVSGNPTGHGWLFVHLDDEDGPQIYCYVMPSGF